MFIGYFDESKKNITIDNQKSIVVSYINKHNLNVDTFFSTDFSSIIIQKLQSGLSYLKTAKEVGISVTSLYNFLYFEKNKQSRYINNKNLQDSSL